MRPPAVLLFSIKKINVNITKQKNSHRQRHTPVNVKIVRGNYFWRENGVARHARGRGAEKAAGNDDNL